MEKRIVEKINSINEEFYRNFAKSFSATRGRIQPGVAHLLTHSNKSGNWLDIGCGNGTLARALIEQGFSGRYLGVDFSQGLIEEARRITAEMQQSSDINIDFQCMDINQTGWAQEISEIHWDTISIFAVLHHIPSHEQRFTLCKQIRELLVPNKPVYVSVWQLKNSPRLFSRVKPWQVVGIHNDEVEDGDVLMDWRAGQKQEESSQALRYVHVFSEDELVQLAQNSNFEVTETFYSDGKEGNLALYQVWLIKKIS